MPKKGSDESELEISEVVSDLRKRMRELERLGKKLKEEDRAFSPARTKHFLEELKIPPIKLLKEK